jgi:hypothetical protein
MSTPQDDARALQRQGAQQDFSLVISVPNIPAFEPERARAVINTLTLQTMRLALQEVAGRVSDEAHVFADTGHLAQSFGADPATPDGGIEIDQQLDSLNGRVFSSLPYALVMEEGRTPGRPINQAGIDAIGLWAQRKLGLSAEEADRAKWGIAFAIVQRGIPGRHYAEKGWTAAQPTIQSLFDALGQAIREGLTRA